jgi:hypothetical protein
MPMASNQYPPGQGNSKSIARPDEIDPTFARHPRVKPGNDLLPGRALTAPRTYDEAVPLR